MSRPDHTLVNAIAQDILNYIASRPNAADTVDGIKSWWLPMARRKASVQTIEEALDMLVKKNLLRRTRTTTAKVIYQAVDG